MRGQVCPRTFPVLKSGLQWVAGGILSFFLSVVPKRASTQLHGAELELLYAASPVHRKQSRKQLDSWSFFQLALSVGTW